MITFLRSNNMKVRNYNTLNLDPDKSVLVSSIEIDKPTIEEVLHGARNLAARWNNQTSDRTKHVNIIVCQGHVTCVY